MWLTWGGSVGLTGQPSTLEVRSCSSALSWSRDPDRLLVRYRKATDRSLSSHKRCSYECLRLILDEPFTGLDINAAHTLIELITEAQNTGTSVLMSAHEVETLPISMRVLHLTDGVLSEVTAERPVHDQRVAVAVQVQLGVGTTMGNAHSISELPGVMSVQSDSRQGVTLLLQPEYREAILGAAIAAGWHVLSVGPPGGGFESL